MLKVFKSLILTQEVRNKDDQDLAVNAEQSYQTLGLETGLKTAS